MIKCSIFSYLGIVYDLFGIILFIMVEGKYIYWEVCDEKKGWNVEVFIYLRD